MKNSRGVALILALLVLSFLTVLGSAFSPTRRSISGSAITTGRNQSRCIWPRRESKMPANCFDAPVGRWASGRSRPLDRIADWQPATISR